MPRFRDLTGQVFGRLTVLHRAPNQKQEVRWLCQCACGNTCIVYRAGLQTQTTLSCGCYHSEISKRNAADLTGQVFHRWTVGERGPNKGKRVYWWCRCSCGEMRLVLASTLCSGRSESCGCLRRERVSRAGTTHGMSFSPEYKIWKHIKQRCLNPKSSRYPDWGGRGITVCERWQNSFEAFYEDMGPRPGPAYSIERVRNSEGYRKENCIWATAVMQMRNTRRNLLFTIDGKTACLAEWITIVGKNRQTVLGRLNRGWSVEEALFTPIK